ncbi:hypothetical protein QQ054_00140 [Oscillatoria amoena NRMC-F 0135]|nr:hypothetical protein [Oscillatoria amoena NRMC-F 0135]
MSGKGIIGILLICLTTAAQAQQWPFELWHEGKIVLASGDTLKGLVKYDLEQDLVQFNDQKDNIAAYTARKVLFFEIFDNTQKRYRSFFALPYAASNTSYLTPIFFELLEDGKMTLLAREALEYRTFSSPYYYGSFTRLVLVYRFFLMDEKGNITQFTGKKADLLGMMGRKANDVDQYMRKNRLKIEDPSDFARTVAYYNSLF